MDLTEKNLEQTEKQKKAIKILKNKEIDKCCEWLLKAHNASALREVPNVEHVKQEEQQHCEFFYDKKHYQLGLLHNPPRFPTIAFNHGELIFRVMVDSECVLKTTPVKDKGVIKINIDSLSKVVLDDWLETLHKIVVKGQAIEEIQYQQQKEEKERKRQQEQEEKARKLDKNIHLGKYK